MGLPWLGASARRTLRGTTAAKTRSRNILRTSATTAWFRAARLSTMVRSAPSTRSAGFSSRCTIARVLSRCPMPVRAKNSACTGISTLSAAASPLRVTRPSEGGQSTTTKA